MDDDLGPRLLELLGEPACVELLAVLELPETDRAEHGVPAGHIFGNVGERDAGRADRTAAS